MQMPDARTITYEEFQKQYAIQQKEDAFIHWRFIYHDACQEPLDKNLIVFVCHGTAAESDIMFRLLKYWNEYRRSEGKTVRVIATKKASVHNIPDFPEGCLVITKDANRPEISRLYGHAGCIVTAGWLPAFFVRREGQQVINLYEPFEEDKKYNRLKNADRRLSSFLNSSIIWTENQAQLKLMRQTEQIDNIYQGKFLTFSTDDEEDSFKKLLMFIFDSIEEDACFFKSCATKKKLLLYYSRSKKHEYFQLLKLFTDSIDYEKWDITFLCQKASSASEEADLLSLHPDVRILYAVNQFNCSPEEAIEQEYLIQNIFSFDDLAEVISLLKPSILLTRFQGVFGKTDFDEFIQFGRRSTLSVCLVKSVSVKRARKVELEDYTQELNTQDTPEQTLESENQMKLYGQIYQQLVFPTEELKQAALETGFYDDKQLQVFPFPFKFPVNHLNHPFQMVNFRERPYAICDSIKQPFQNLYMKIIPCPTEKENGYLIDATQTDLNFLFQILTQNNAITPADRWFVAGIQETELRRIISKYGVEDHSYVIDSILLESWSDFPGYLQRFIGYLTTNKEDSSSIRIATELSGRTIFYVSETGITQIKGKLFSDANIYNQFVAEEYHSFLDEDRMCI